MSTSTTSPAKGFNLGAAKEVSSREDDGTLVELTDERDEPLRHGETGIEHPVTIRVAGTYSLRWRRAEERQRKRMVKRNRRPNDEEIFTERLTLVADCVMAWEGFYDATGAVLEFTVENVVKVFRAAPWILRQVELAADDHERFFSPSAIS